MLPPQDLNEDPWGIGERDETQRRNLLKALVSARKELSENGKVAEELKAWLQALTEEARIPKQKRRQQTS